jgi:hypothetical protein
LKSKKKGGNMKKEMFSKKKWSLCDLSLENDPQKEKTCREWSIYTSGPIAYVKTDWGERGEANARLMAASSIMFSALKVALLNLDGERPGAARIVSASISSALGE